MAEAALPTQQEDRLLEATLSTKVCRSYCSEVKAVACIAISMHHACRPCRHEIVHAALDVQVTPVSIAASRVMRRPVVVHLMS